MRRPYLTSAPDGAEVSREAVVERARDAVASRAQRFEALCPEANDLSALATAALYGQLHGRVAALHSPRGSEYLRRQLRAEQPATTEDWAFLAIEAPLAFIAGLSPLVNRAGYGLVPLDPVNVNLSEAVAAFSEQANRPVSTHTRLKEDGTIDSVDAEQILAEVEATERRLAILRAALQRVKR